MKKIFLLFALSILSVQVNAQLSGCNSAQNICTNPNFQFVGVSGTGLPSTLTISNPGTNPQTGNGANPSATPNSGCLLTNGPGPQWLILTVSTAGNLGFTFGDPNSPNPQVGFYDWAMWPYTPSTCNNIFNNTLPPVSCNWNASSSGGTGMGTPPSGGVPGNYQPSFPVTPGQQFLILISNYSGVNTLVSFTSTGTASLTCGLNLGLCSGQSYTVSPIGFVPLTNPSFTLMPGNLSNTTGSFVVSPTVTTTYTLSGTGTNAQGTVVAQTSTTSVNVSPQPSAAISLTQTTCYNDSNAVNVNITYTPTPSGAVSYTVNWSPVPPGVTTGTQTFVNGQIPAGLYNTTVTSAGGCSTTASFSINPQPTPALLNFQPFNTNHTITCFQPSITVTALVATNNYTWNNNIIAPIMGTNAVVFTNTMVGTWTVTAEHPTSHCVSTKTITVGADLSTPTSSISPPFQNITCSLSSVQTVTIVASPSVNILNEVYAPQGGTFSASSYTTIYYPGGVGIYTTASINSNNGCAVYHTFTVTSNQSFPTYSVSSPDSYTLGCTTKSVATVNIVNPQGGGGGAASYTILAPGSSAPGGLLSTSTTYTMNNPGTYTVIVRDNVSFCETSTPISIISNTLPPNIDVDTLTGNYILNCFDPDVVLYGKSLTPGVSFQWNFPFLPGTKASDSLTVNSLTATPNNSVVGVFTLQVTNTSSTCKSTSMVTVYQNLYKPTALIAGLKQLTCNTKTITLNNQSSSNVPTGSIFQTGKPVTGYRWEGPSPQEPLMISTSYIAGVPGDYTLTVMDQNNGCKTTTVYPVADGKVYPSIKGIDDTLSCGAISGLIGVNILNFKPTEVVYKWRALSVITSTTGDATKQFFPVTEPGKYAVEVTNIANGCALTTTAQLLTDSVNAAFDSNPVSGYAPLDVVFYNNSATTSGDGKGIEALWNFGNGKDTATNASNLSPSTTYSIAGTYTVILYVNKGKCLDSTMRIIKVEIPSELTIPNIFSPNGDGANDVFFLKTSSLSSISISIYDRWGHVVYQLDSSNGNVAWDGKNQYGKDCAEGVYFYMIKSTGKDGKDYDKKGTITLVR